MRNPFRRRRPTGIVTGFVEAMGRATGTVTVTIVADTSRFEEAIRRAGRSLHRARHASGRTGEAFRVLAYRHRLAEERERGLAYVDEQLDGLCEHFGMDPVEVWRRPHDLERRARRVLDAIAQGVVWIPPHAFGLAESEWRNPEPCRRLCCPTPGFHTVGECGGTRGAR